MRIFVLVLALFAAAGAWACRCRVIEVNEGFAASAAVFEARVVSSTGSKFNGSGGDSDRDVVAQLDVLQVWKSDSKRLKMIRSQSSSAACGYYLEPGKRYIIFAQRDESRGFWSFLPFVKGDLRVTSCSGTALVEPPVNCESEAEACRAHEAEIAGLREKLSGLAASKS